jgi:O-antigen/teichoic acid export membrane protein
VISSRFTVPARFRLVANAGWASLGTGSLALAQWGMVVLIAKKETPEQLGDFIFALAVATPVMLFANLQLRAVQATDAAGRFSFATYARLRLLTTAAAVGVIMAGSLALARATTWAGMLALVTLMKGVEALSDITYGRLQHADNLRAIGRSQLLRAVLSIGSLGLVFALGGRARTALALTAGAWLCVFALHDVRHAGLGRLTAASILFSDADLAPLFRLSFPLGLSIMLSMLTIHVPRYFVAGFRGPRELGIYGALSYFVIAGNLVAASIGEAISPRLSRLYDSGEGPEFMRTVVRAAAIVGLLGIFLAIGAWAASGWLLALLYRPEYEAFGFAFSLLMAAAAVGYVACIFGYAATAAQQFRAQATLGAVLAGSVLLFGSLLIPALGLTGAALTQAAVACVQLIGSAAITRKSIGSRCRDPLACKVGYAKA